MEFDFSRLTFNPLGLVIAQYPPGTVMTLTIIILLCVLFVLLCFSAFFSSAETALFSLSPIHIHRIKRTHPKVARQIEQLLATPTSILSTILIGNTLVNVTAANIGFIVAEHFFHPYGEAVAIPVMTILLILFGDAAPKRLAIRRPEALARAYLPLLKLLITAFTPLRVLLDKITHWLPKHLTPIRPALTEDELLTAVDVGHEEGILTNVERTMVDGIIRLETLQARDVMTPRVDLIGIDINGDPATYPEICRKARFRFLPVYRNDLDHIEGFLDVARFLLNPRANIQAAIQPHFYVPDTAPLDSLLNMFQQQSKRLAIVIDEYGGTAGLITRGDIQDEIAQMTSENPEENTLDIEPTGPNRWLVDGSTSLEQINYELDLKLETEGADRVAGWITAHTGRIPKTGDVIEEQDCRATVIKMRKHRITQVQLEKIEPTPVTPQDSREGLS